MMRRLPLTLLFLFACLTVVALPQQVAAQFLDPADIHVTQCSTYGGTCGGGDPNPIFGPPYSGWITSSKPITGDLLLILSAPDMYDNWAVDLGFTDAVQGTQNGQSWSLDTDGDYGWHFPAGSQTAMTSGQEVYSYIGLQGANNSNSYTNFLAADYDASNFPPGTNPLPFAAGGQTLDPNNFDPSNEGPYKIERYGISVFEFAADKPIDTNPVGFTLTDGHVVPGTILSVYIINAPCANGVCHDETPYDRKTNPGGYDYDSTNPYANAFTEAGLYANPRMPFNPENPVPEPGSLMLFGTGLVGLAGFLKKRFA